ncbi:DUF4062 domain-containing protein [Caulobacter sp. FWC2]|uniref:DUF4062 domain-containing protein n=1 Tax=Caulobacter sp. FWC2 TaxID=69664 RepID=UPI001304741A|nr:DUF4062 domain-containing protein [Caulobacter sp. FWC2]
MAEHTATMALSDRLQVFISSTIAECAAEREAARRAILGLNFTAVQFEREGARAEAPRAFYLRKLQGAHIVVAIYRNAYGWIDEAKGMMISGLEDEYREAVRLEKDLLVYVLKPPVDRNPRLASMLDEIMSGPNTLYFYEEGEDLEARIRDDITALVSRQVAQFQSADSSVGSASALLERIFRGSPFRIRRTGLLEHLTKAAALGRIVWVNGVAGAGKTALAAEWAAERSAPYVNARGLDPRATLVEMVRALGVADGAELAAPVFDDARALLFSRWASATRWPIVLDDPDDVEAVWSVLSECLATSGTGSVVIVVRDVAAHLPGERVEVSAFTPDELAALEAIAGSTVPAKPGDLPIAVRRAAGGSSPIQSFDVLDAGARELLGYMALSPTPLALSDLAALVGGPVGAATAIVDKLEPMADVLIETPAGFGFVHEHYREGLVARLGDHPQLRALLLDRLAKQLARTGRAWAAFALRRYDDPQLAERLANRTVREAAFTGSTRHLVDALEFLATYYRDRAEHGPLISVLLSLADAKAHQGRPAEVPVLLEEASSIARTIGDAEAERTIDVLQASIALRRTPTVANLARIRQLGQAAKDEGRLDDYGRLLIEEGVALLSANEVDVAAPAFRSAREIFIDLKDAYGVDTATRNLIGALSISPDGAAESERLRATLGGEQNSPRYRAWLCNLLVPKLRREKRFAEAEAMANEAVAIGESLGDQYLVAINQTILGNVLREGGRIDEAIKAYKLSGQNGQKIGRIDIEGRSSRLLALTENEAAEASSGAERRAHAERAEQYAIHAAGLFADSFAWSEYGFALEERGDARRWQDRMPEAIDDYADAVASYLKADDQDEASRLLRFLAAALKDVESAPQIMARAFGTALDAKALGRSGVWVEALKVALEHCPRAVAPHVLGVLVRNFDLGVDDWWFANFTRCLLAASQMRNLTTRPALGSLLLLAVLGFSRHRQFSTQDLLTLASLCISDFDRLIIRHRPNDDFIQVIHLGKDERVLFTIRDEGKRAESIFVALCIGSFLDAFGDELADILFADGPAEGAVIDVMIFAQANESEHVSKFFAEGLKDKAVGTARIEPEGDEETPIVMYVRPDATIQLQANEEHSSELELMLMRFLQEVVHATLGKTVDDETFGAKLRDLLMQVFR